MPSPRFDGGQAFPRSRQQFLPPLVQELPIEGTIGRGSCSRLPKSSVLFQKSWGSSLLAPVVVRQVAQGRLEEIAETPLAGVGAVKLAAQKTDSKILGKLLGHLQVVHNS